jgi:hypothetical protein
MFFFLKKIELNYFVLFIWRFCCLKWLIGIIIVIKDICKAVYWRNGWAY